MGLFVPDYVQCTLVGEEKTQVENKALSYFKKMFPKAGSNNGGCVESQESGHRLSIWIPSYGPRLTLHRLGVGWGWGGGGGKAHQHKTV